MNRAFRALHLTDKRVCCAAHSWNPLSPMTEQQSAPENPEVSQKKLEAKRKKEFEANRKALDDLCELYPDVFNRDAPKPLQIGIHEAIAADGKLSKTRIRRALNLYVRLRKYVACLTEGASRITIDGSETGKVTAEEASHAAEKLAEIDKRRAARKPQPKRKPQKSGKPAEKGAPRRKSQPRSKPKTDKPAAEDKRSPEERMQAKLAALVNKPSQS